MPTVASPDEQRRAAALRQLQEDRDFEAQQAEKRKHQANIQVGVQPPAPAAVTPTPAKPAQPSAPSAPTISGAASALRGRNIEDMEKRYNFAKGTPYVEGPPGRDKVKAQLTRGEAVLPTETVKAIGTQNIADMIERTSGHKPQRKLSRGKGGTPHLKAFFGYTPDQEEAIRRADIAYRDASNKAAANRLDITTPHFIPVNEAFKADAGANATATPAPARKADRIPREQPNVPVPVARASAGQPPMAPAAVTAPPRSYMEQYYPETRRNYMESGPAIDQAYQQGGIPAAAGMTARKAVSYLPAVASDVYRNVVEGTNVLATPINEVLKTALTGDARPINPKPTTAAAAATSPSAPEAGRPSATGPNAAGAAPPIVPGQVNIPGKDVNAYTIANLPQGYAFAGNQKGGKLYTPEALDQMKGYTGRWEDTQQYKDAIALAAQEKRQADLIDIGEAARTQSGLAGEREKAAAIALARPGIEAQATHQAAAQQALQQAQELQTLRQQISAARDPKEQRRLIAAYRALSGQKDTQAPIAVKGGQALGPDNMTVFAQPESVYDPNIGAYVPNPTGGPQTTRTVTKAQLQQIMTEGGLDEAGAIAYLKQNGYSVM